MTYYLEVIMKTNTKRFIFTAITLLLSAVLISPPLVYAQSDDTDGTEIQVLQPEQLEIQLGTDWAGVEFWLKTDSGMYPDPIPVGEDGVLRLEIGGSTHYTLSCLGTDHEASASEPSGSLETAEADAPETASDAIKTPEPTEPREPVEGSDDKDTAPAPEVSTVAGIPVKHLVFFGLGLFICILVLAAMKIASVNRAEDAEFDEYDED